jgi:hypothetical protein
MDKLQILWDAIIKYGHEIRSSNKDGFAGWVAIKQKLTPFDFKLEWTEASKLFAKELEARGVNNSDSFETSGLATHELWEKNHFLFQHGRIIRNSPEATLVRLLQIAYNVGQFNAENEKNKYSSELLAFYHTNKLDKLTTFIKPIESIIPEVLTKIGTALDIKFSGGVYEYDIERTMKGGGGEGSSNKRSRVPLFKQHLNDYITHLKYYN